MIPVGFIGRGLMGEPVGGRPPQATVKDLLKNINGCDFVLWGERIRRDVVQFRELYYMASGPCATKPERKSGFRIPPERFTSALPLLSSA